MHEEDEPRVKLNLVDDDKSRNEHRIQDASTARSTDIGYGQNQSTSALSKNHFCMEFTYLSLTFERRFRILENIFM